MSNRVLPSGFVKSVLNNGAGRYVCQLQRLTIKFCKSHADSRGMRDFIEKHLVDFSRKHSGVVVYVQPRQHRTPRLVAEYLNGEVHQLYVQNYSAEEICKWVDLLRTRSGEKIVRLRKPQHTDSASIQGVWTPFTNKPTDHNLHRFPDDSLSRALPLEKSATERLLEAVAGGVATAPQLRVTGTAV